MESFKFLTNSIEYDTVGLKGKREYYVTGYISTEEIDRAGEVVTREAMQEMVAQIKSGNVKLDIEHSTFTGENDIPVGKIVDAGLDAKGVWVKCVMNKSHGEFTTYWNSIKDGFLDAFSIAYQVKSAVDKMVNGVKVTYLRSLELLNVAITGNPVNTGAKMTESFYKSLKSLKEHNLKGENMTEQTQPAEMPAPEVVEPKQEVAQEEVAPEPEHAQEVAEEQKPEPVIAEPEPAVVAEPEPAVEEPAFEPMPLDQIKSLEAVNAKLKAEHKALQAKHEALIKEFNKPILKSVVNTQMTEAEEKNKVHDVAIKSAFDTIK